MPQCHMLQRTQGFRACLPIIKAKKIFASDSRCYPKQAGQGEEERKSVKLDVCSVKIITAYNFTGRLTSVVHVGRVQFRFTLAGP